MAASLWSERGRGERGGGEEGESGWEEGFRMEARWQGEGATQGEQRAVAEKEKEKMDRRWDGGG